MKENIQDNKFVELTYKVVDQKTGGVLSTVEFPLSYVHGATDILASDVTEELAGKSVGDTIQLPIDCDQLYGPRDETLVFTDHLENVPEDYRSVGTTIVMENDKGEPKNFIVTRIDEKTLTVDGNNPLCGREVVFTLEVLTVRDASNEEIEAGGAVGAGADPDIHEILK
jgi:FKBP-type peptidyl-prolyl cis-trans isomerase SlyD